MLRPFPFPLHVGTDICSISRIFNILTRTRNSKFLGEKFVKRLLNEKERKSYADKLLVLDQLRAKAAVGPTATSQLEFNGSHDEASKADAWKLAEFLAGRWAAKEATIKAHPYRRFTFHDITIIRRELGVPGPSSLSAYGHEKLRSTEAPVAWVRAMKGESQEVRLSISHDGQFATAVCLAAEIGMDDSWNGGGLTGQE